MRAISAAIFTLSESSRTFDALIPLLVVTVLYFLLAWLLGLLLNLASSKIKVL